MQENASNRIAGAGAEGKEGGFGCVYFNGAQGDVSPRAPKGDAAGEAKEKKSEAAKDDEGSGPFAACRRMGERLGDEVAILWKETATRAEVSISTERFPFTRPMRPSSSGYTIATGDHSSELNAIRIDGARARVALEPTRHELHLDAERLLGLLGQALELLDPRRAFLGLPLATQLPVTRAPDQEQQRRPIRGSPAGALHQLLAQRGAVRLRGGRVGEALQERAQRRVAGAAARHPGREIARVPHHQPVLAPETDEGERPHPAVRVVRAGRLPRRRAAQRNLGVDEAHLPRVIGQLEPPAGPRAPLGQRERQMLVVSNSPMASMTTTAASSKGDVNAPAAACDS